MAAADTVTFAGFAATNGYTAAELNITHTITAVERDSYTITVAGAVTQVQLLLVTVVVLRVKQLSI